MRAGLAALVTLLIVFGLGELYLSRLDSMSQSSFPCQEDEVLGYAPKFGPHKVGCLSIEEIK